MTKSSAGGGDGNARRARMLRSSTVRVAAILLACSAVFGCYDVDSLRSGRNQPLDAARPNDPDDAGDAGDASPPPDAPPPCGTVGPGEALVAYYPLDETTGVSVPDCSTSQLHGAFVGAPVWTPARNSGGLRITPQGCVQLGTAASASALDFRGAFSLTAWILVTSFPDGGSAAGYIVGKTDDPDLAGFRIATGPGFVNGAIARPSSARLSVSAPMALGTFVHVAFVVHPGGTAELYTDGVLRASQPGVPDPLLPDPAASARMGCRSDGTQPFDGILDDVRAYARALSPEEIAELAR